MDTAENIAPVVARPSKLRSATTNGNRPFVLGGDGRGAWVRRWRDLVELHVNDLGGPSACSEAQLSLCRRIATTSVETERLEARMSEGDDTVDLDVFNRPAGNLRRMLESIGLQRESSRESVDAVVVRGRHELPPQANVHYVAFVDASGGSAESMAVGIAHRNADGLPVLNVVREASAPFSPDSVTAEFASLLRSYGVSRVTGDNYGGQYPQERIRAYGISYQVLERSKSDIYKHLLPLVNSEQVELLDNSRLINQLCSLERNVSRGGRETINHPKGWHVDVVNAAAGALTNVSYECAPRILRYGGFSS
jgi:hypothetical protein